MLGASPIETWEGAGAIFTFAAGGASLWFWLSVALCIVPLVVSLIAESAAESEHG
jgi:hypothetical protein